MKKRGVFASALVKKRCFWPKYIRDDDIKRHFKGKEVGTAEAWGGMLEGSPFHLYCMKESDYVMTLMSTYGTLEANGNVSNRVYMEGQAKRQKTITYSEVINNHYKFRHLKKKTQ